MPLHDLLSEISSRYPTRTALSWGARQQWTYAELDAVTNKLAHFLRGEGIKTGDKVGIFYERSYWQVCYMVALSKIGAVYVPFNPMDYDRSDKSSNFGKKYQKQINQMKACSLSLLMTNDNLHNIAIQLGGITKVRTGKLNDTSDLNDFSPRSVDNKNQCDESIAYIILSSGTTGKPKGIPIKHKGIKAWFEQLKRELPQPKSAEDETTRVALQIPTGFDPHIWEYIMTWASAGCAYLADEMMTDSASNLLEHCLIRRGITDVTMTPSTFSDIAVRRENITRLKLAGLKRIYLTGESLTPSSIRILSEPEPGAPNGIKIYNCYGPSELTFGFSMKPVSIAELSDDGQRVEIGLEGLPGVEAYLRLKPHDNESQNNTIPSIIKLGDKDLDSSEPILGELLIASPYLTPGYLGTSKAHCEIIKLGTQEKTIYPTGDLVSIENNKLYYRRRVRNRLKLKNNWVDTQSISAIIKGLTGCENVLVSVAKIERQEYLYALLDHRFEKNRETELRQQLTTKLPRHEVPSFLINLQSLGDNLSTMPVKVGSGKVDSERCHMLARQYIERHINESKHLDQAKANYFKCIKKQPPELLDVMSAIKDIIIAWVSISLGNLTLNAHDIDDITLTELGLSSLDCRRLSTKITSLFEHEIGVGELFNVTPKKLTEKLLTSFVYQSCFKAPTTSNKHGRCEDEQPIVFALPPITGSIKDYTILERDAIRLLAFEPPIFNKMLAQQKDLYEQCKSTYFSLKLTELANHIATAICKIQPEGALYLAGWSFGGDLAWEVGKQLIYRNRVVERLLIVDSQAPKGLNILSTREFVTRLQDIIKYIAGQRLKGLNHKIITPSKILEHTLELDKEKHIIVQSNTIIADLFFKRVFAVVRTWRDIYTDLTGLIDDLSDKLKICQAHINMLLTWHPSPISQLEDLDIPFPETIIAVARQGINHKEECSLDDWQPYLPKKTHRIDADCTHFDILQHGDVQTAYTKHFANRLPYAKTLPGSLKHFYKNMDHIKLKILNKRIPLADTIPMAVVSNRDANDKQQNLLKLTQTQHIRWSYEDVFCIEKKIQYLDLLDKGEKVLVLGRAGIGKSTFCRRMVSDWAHKRAWQQYKAVIWLELKHLQEMTEQCDEEVTNGQLAMYILNALKKQNCEDERFTEHLSVENIEVTLEDESNEVLWLLDGYDEIAHTTLNNPNARRYFNKLIKQANVIVTSRPNAIEQSELNTIFPNKVELLGFDDEQILEFTNKIFQLRGTSELNDDSKLDAESFIKFIKQNSNLWGLVHVPVNLEIMASILNQESIHDCKHYNLANLYTDVINNLKLRALKSEPWGLIDNSIKLCDIEDYYEELDNHLSTIALKQLSNRKVLFSSKELNLSKKVKCKLDKDIKKINKRVRRLGREEVDIDDTSDYIKFIHQLGILNSTSTEMGNVDSHYFIHLTYQEYYAAKKLRELLLNDGTKETIKEYLVRPEFEMVMIYVAGLISARDDDESDSDSTDLCDVFFGIMDDCLDETCHSEIYPFYEKDPRLFCLRIRCLEQCNEDFIESQSMFFVSLRHAISSILANPAKYPEYNAQNRIKIIQTLQQCHRVLEKSQLVSHLHEIRKSRPVDIAENLIIIENQLTDDDYARSLLSSINEISTPSTKRALLELLLPLVTTDNQVEQFFIEHFYEFVPSGLEFSEKTKLIHNILERCADKDALQYISNKLYSVISNNNCSLEQRFLMVLALSKCRIFELAHPEQAAQGKPTIELMSTLHDAETLLNSNDSMFRYHAAVLLSENMNAASDVDQLASNICQALEKNKKCSHPFINMASEKLIGKLRGFSNQKMMNRQRNQMKYALRPTPTSKIKDTAELASLSHEFKQSFLSTMKFIGAFIPDHDIVDEAIEILTNDNLTELEAYRIASNLLRSDNTTLLFIKSTTELMNTNTSFSLKVINLIYLKACRQARELIESALKCNKNEGVRFAFSGLFIKRILQAVKSETISALFPNCFSSGLDNNLENSSGDSEYDTVDKIMNKLRDEINNENIFISLNAKIALSIIDSEYKVKFQQYLNDDCHKLRSRALQAMEALKQYDQLTPTLATQLISTGNSQLIAQTLSILPHCPTVEVDNEMIIQYQNLLLHTTDDNIVKKVLLNLLKYHDHFPIQYTLNHNDPQINLIGLNYLNSNKSSLETPKLIVQHLSCKNSNVALSAAKYCFRKQIYMDLAAQTCLDIMNNKYSDNGTKYESFSLCLKNRHINEKIVEALLKLDVKCIPGILVEKDEFDFEQYETHAVTSFILKIHQEMKENLNDNNLCNRQPYQRAFIILDQFLSKHNSSKRAFDDRLTIKNNIPKRLLKSIYSVDAQSSRKGKTISEHFAGYELRVRISDGQDCVPENKKSKQIRIFAKHHHMPVTTDGWYRFVVDYMTANLDYRRTQLFQTILDEMKNELSTEQYEILITQLFDHIHSNDCTLLLINSLVDIRDPDLKQLDILLKFGLNNMDNSNLKERIEKNNLEELIFHAKRNPSWTNSLINKLNIHNNSPSLRLRVLTILCEIPELLTKEKRCKARLVKLLDESTHALELGKALELAASCGWVDESVNRCIHQHFNNEQEIILTLSPHTIEKSHDKSLKKLLLPHILNVLNTNNQPYRNSLLKLLSNLPIVHDDDTFDVLKPLLNDTNEQTKSLALNVLLKLEPENTKLIELAMSDNGNKAKLNTRHECKLMAMSALIKNNQFEINELADEMNFILQSNINADLRNKALKLLEQQPVLIKAITDKVTQHLSAFAGDSSSKSYSKLSGIVSPLFSIESLLNNHNQLIEPLTLNTLIKTILDHFSNQKNNPSGGTLIINQDKFFNDFFNTSCQTESTINKGITDLIKVMGILGRFNSETVELLLTLLNDDKPSLRESLIASLVDCANHQPETQHKLIVLLNNSDSINSEYYFKILTEVNLTQENSILLIPTVERCLNNNHNSKIRNLAAHMIAVQCINYAQYWKPLARDCIMNLLDSGSDEDNLILTKLITNIDDLSTSDISYISKAITEKSNSQTLNILCIMSIRFPGNRESLNSMFRQQYTSLNEEFDSSCDSLDTLTDLLEYTP